MTQTSNVFENRASGGRRNTQIYFLTDSKQCLMNVELGPFVQECLFNENALSTNPTYVCKPERELVLAMLQTHVSTTVLQTYINTNRQ